MVNITLNAELEIDKNDLPVTVVVNKRPEFWETNPNGGEVNTQMPVTNGSVSPVQIYRINIGPVEAGDLIEVDAEAEFTNDTVGMQVSVVSGLLLATSQTAVYGASPSIEIDEINGANFDQSLIHHHVHSKHGAHLITETDKTALGNNDVWVVFFGWAVAGSDYQANKYVAIGQDYGRMFVKRWRETPEGEISTTVIPSQTGNSGKFLTTNGTATSWATTSGASLPSQTGNSGKYLTTDGTNPSWGTPSGTLPSQTSNAGKFLKTDGTNASWESPTSAITTFTPTVIGLTSAGSCTYVTQIGKYVKNGPIVSYYIRVKWTGHTGTGQMCVAGLPYTANDYFGVNFYTDGVTIGSGKQIGGLVDSGNTRINIYAQDVAGGASSSLAMDSAGELFLSGIYFTNS